MSPGAGSLRRGGPSGDSRGAHTGVHHPGSERSGRGPAVARPVRPEPGVLRRRQLQPRPDRVVRPADRTGPAAHRHRRHDARHGGQRHLRHDRVRRRRRRLGHGVRACPAAHVGTRPDRPRGGTGAAGRRRSGSARSAYRAGTRLFVSYLAVANLFFLGSFFFLSPTSELVAGGSSGDLGDVSVPTLRAPVVVIVLDEFPAATLMRADGSLNDDAVSGLRRAGVGEHLVPQRIEPVQPHAPRRTVDPRRHVG